MLIFYVRHGDPIYDPDSLTPLGHRQAESVAKRLAQFGVDEVYASTSTRAMQTAQPLCELLHKKLVTLDFLHEEHMEPMRLREPGEKPIWIWTHPYYSQVFTRRDVREMGDKWYEQPEFKDFHFENVILPIQEKMDAFFASHGYEHDSDLGLYRVTERHYEKRIASRSCAELVDLTLSIYRKREEMLSQKRKFGAIDERYMKRAEDLLFGELSVVLGITKGDVRARIHEKLHT